MDGYEAEKYNFDDLAEMFSYDFTESHIDWFYEWLEENEDVKNWVIDQEDREDIAGIDRSYREWRDRYD